MKYLLFCLFLIPTITFASPKDVIPRIQFFSTLYNVDSKIPINVAYAESRFNPRAKNASSTATGIFQFTKATWLDNCTSDFTQATDTELNIECAVRLISQHQLSRWKSSEEANGQGWGYLPYTALTAP